MLGDVSDVYNANYFLVTLGNFMFRSFFALPLVYLLILTCLLTNTAYGRDLAVKLLSQDGSAITIATLHEQDKTFKLQLNDEVFTEHFLSMRPFVKRRTARSSFPGLPSNTMLQSM